MTGVAARRGRRWAAVAAVLALVLQLFGGGAPAEAAPARDFFGLIICSSAEHGPSDDAPAGHDGHCDCCLAACAAAGCVATGRLDAAAWPGPARSTELFAPRSRSGSDAAAPRRSPRNARAPPLRA
jgi:hypothetical protein